MFHMMRDTSKGYPKFYEHKLLESCKKGCGLESENAWISEMTNGTWLQLVRSCALPTVQLVPDFKLWSSQESSRYPRVAHRGRV